MHPKCNTANDADVYELDLSEHDLVIMATDGVFDNLWDHDLEKLIKSYLKVLCLTPSEQLKCSHPSH